MEEKVLTHDERVQLLFDKLTAKKAEVANAEKPQYVTGGMFRYAESMGNTIDIVSVRDERKLVEILTFLKERSEKYPDAAKELGTDVNFTWLGFTVEEWLKDLKTRVSVLQIARRRTELAELELKINAVVSPELRQKMEMAKLEAYFD
ncbi:MAG: hypothetical protein ACOH2V_00475 [Candidatus Saccharimonadaceae bacterium]